MLILLMLITFAIRNFVPYSLLFDTVVCVAIYLVYINIEWGKRCNQVLAFLGKHSFNIFLFHTFIYAYYWQELIFWSRNPILIFLTLLTVCIVISVFIEKLKKRIYFDNVCKYIVNLLT